MELDTLKQYVAILQECVDSMKSEIAIAEKKAFFAYPRSKNIRNDALKVVKVSRDIRNICLTLFKADDKHTKELNNNNQ